MDINKIVATVAAAIGIGIGIFALLAAAPTQIVVFAFAGAIFGAVGLGTAQRQANAALQGAVGGFIFGAFLPAIAESVTSQIALDEPVRPLLIAIIGLLPVAMTALGAYALVEKLKGH